MRFQKETHYTILVSVRQFLQVKKWKVKRIQQGPLSEKGLADLFAMRGGILVFVEIKTKNDGLSKDQMIFKLDCEDSGIPYCVCRSVEDAMKMDEKFTPKREEEKGENRN